MIESGVALLAAGLMLAPLVHSPWQLYATLGVLVIAGGNCLGYTAHAVFLTRPAATRPPSWSQSA